MVQRGQRACPFCGERNGFQIRSDSEVKQFSHDSTVETVFSCSSCGYAAEVAHEGNVRPRSRKEWRKKYHRERLPDGYCLPYCTKCEHRWSARVDDDRVRNAALGQELSSCCKALVAIAHTFDEVPGGDSLDPPTETALGLRRIRPLLDEPPKDIKRTGNRSHYLSPTGIAVRIGYNWVDVVDGGERVQTMTTSYPDEVGEQLERTSGWTRLD